ncbi:MAG: DUF294 nucleotidyltransferase-like domain-containing protein, partial [Planctomycetaceae bacterium]
MNPRVISAEPPSRLAEHRGRVAEIRRHARQLFEGGATGIQIAADIADAINAFAVERLTDALADNAPREARRVEQNSALVAVGGSGRGEMAPHSDCDLLFLYRPAIRSLFEPCASSVVRDAWDAGIKLGHSLRTIAEAVNQCRQDPHAA